jgi:60 kDa SS-A/Ro ribonucleoprotein
MKYARILSQPTPQGERLSPAQVQNNAGGFVFTLDDWQRLDRFLVLGSDAPTYYQGARELTKENATVVARCYTADPVRTVAAIVDVSTNGRAPKNDAAVFALAVGLAHDRIEARQAAARAVNKVCRTATHLFQFVSLTRVLGRGRGRSMIRAMANWYNEKPVDKVAFQAVKYRDRAGYTHRDLLRLARPQGDLSPARRALFSWIVGKPFEAADAPVVLNAHVAAMKLKPGRELYELMTAHQLPWEAVPTEAKADAGMWLAALSFMGLTALIRNLGQMTRLGVISPLSDGERLVVARLGDREELRRARIHPFTLVQALAVYRAGRPVAAGRFRASNDDRSWQPSQAVLDALDKAFYRAFANVVPTGKRHLLALDVSGSMGTSFIGGVLSAREASAAMALVTAATEDSTHFVGFTSATGRGAGNGLSPLSISPRQRLDQVVRQVSDLPFGGTDCALPMLYALEHKIPVDTFVVYTDNETWAGRIHPSEALARYRREMGIAAKLIVVGMTATGFSIADPTDAGMLDVVGFDAAAPAVMADFVRGGAPTSSGAAELDEVEA